MLSGPRCTWAARWGRMPAGEQPVTEFGASFRTLSTYADDQSARSQAAPTGSVQDEVAGSRTVPVQTGGLPPSQNDDPEEAELGASEGRARAAVQRERNHRLHP